MRSTKLAVTMFFFCILSAAEKIMSSVNKSFEKCSLQSFSVRCELSKFHTRQFKSFQNCKYLAVAFRNYFVKNKNYKVKWLCFSALYMLWNVLIFKKNDPYFSMGKNTKSYATIPRYLSFLFGKGGNPYVSNPT